MSVLRRRRLRAGMTDCIEWPRRRLRSELSGSDREVARPLLRLHPEDDVVRCRPKVGPPLLLPVVQGPVVGAGFGVTTRVPAVAGMPYTVTDAERPCQSFVTWIKPLPRCPGPGSQGPDRRRPGPSVPAPARHGAGPRPLSHRGSRLGP